MPHVIVKLLARKNRVHETPGMKKTERRASERRYALCVINSKTKQKYAAKSRLVHGPSKICCRRSRGRLG